MQKSNTPETILEQALEFEGPHERAAYLDEACGDNETLRVEIESLLDAHFEADAFMDTLADPVLQETASEREGDRIGRYKLLQQIGEGGFGTVYLAEQTEPVKRRVALKVIKAGMDSKEVIARFEAERQALALMDHPNIAKVHDAGTSEGGRPYFVMELVKGVPLTKYCADNDLDTKARLNLFMDARQISLDREVAIKILPREFGEDPEFRASFETEAKAMARLNHPNLIGVYDCGDVRGMPYIVMEYINGKSLYHSAWKTVVEPAQAVEIVKGICDGLAHAHENGVIHRDIKPVNILLTSKAEPKIGDFGLALASGQNGPGLGMGTPGYAAPELFHSPHLADEHADIFAVGVILHELLTGQPPDSAEEGACITTGDSGLDIIWQKAVHPDPAQRYENVSAMTDALAAWKPATGRPAPRQLVAAHAPPQRTKPTKPGFVPRRSKPSLVGKLFIIAGLLVAIAFAHQNLKKHEAQREADNQSQFALNAEHSPPRPRDLGNKPSDANHAAKPSTPNFEPVPGDADIDALNEADAHHLPKSSVDSSGISRSEDDVHVPDDLPALLGRTKDSLGTANPVYPPGTFMIAGRHFAPILRPVNRAEAEHLAGLAGGVIAVPATEEEADGIHQACQFLKASDGFWLGGMKSDSLWNWDSGEPWSFARWGRGTDHDLEESAMVFIPGAEWKNANPSVKASGVLIEWSDDTRGNLLKNAASPDAILNEFDPPVTKAVRGKTKILDKRLGANAKDFEAALSQNQRALPNDKYRLQWKPQVDALNELAKNKRIPDVAAFNALGGKLTPEMAKDCGYYFLKQQQHEKQHTADIAVIRDFHVAKLKKSAEQYRLIGQISMARRISAKADAAADLDAWLASLRPDGLPAEKPLVAAGNDIRADELKFSDWLKIVRFKSDNNIQLLIDGGRMRIAGTVGSECRIDEMARTVTWGNSGKRASITVNPDRKSGVWMNSGGVKRQFTVIQVKKEENAFACPALPADE